MDFGKWVFVGFLCLLRWWICVANGFSYANVTHISYLENYEVSALPNQLMVPLTLIHGAAETGAVCLDGTLPGYHWHRGFGQGANSWLIQLEGGGWCNNRRTCVYRKTTRRGSSNYMEKHLAFTGILSNKPEENPDFYNWNRVKVRYCDGASFASEGYDEQNKKAIAQTNFPLRWDPMSFNVNPPEVNNLYFRGQRIWSAAMEELMAKGMRTADRALLSGCSAGGLASILHCDKFAALFSGHTKVKCLTDAGLFLDAMDVSGGRTLRKFFNGVVTYLGVEKNLPSSCTDHLDPTLCFFPQHLIANIKTPMFILNAAYDAWQVQASLAPPTADPHHAWDGCKMNHARCSSSQIQFFQNFRLEMLNSVKDFSQSTPNGLFINSCFSHCQSERQDTWFADDSPVLRTKPVAIAVGDWYFDRAATKLIDCPYPCDNTCHNLVFR